MQSFSRLREAGRLGLKALCSQSTRGYAAKDVRFGTDGRSAIMAGVDALADAVEVTLGPKGRNVMIEQSFGGPKITKDGVTVAKSIEFKDRAMNLGASLVKSVASTTNDIAGDGTTTATLLTRAILREGLKSVAAGMNPMDLRRGIDAAVSHIVDNLKDRTTNISTAEEIAQVGTISANGDGEIGQLIATAMEKVGKEGVITVADGKTLENELEVVEGMKFDRGYISPYFVTDNKAMRVEFDKPLVLIYDKKISSLQALMPLLEKAVQSQRPLLIIAEDIEGEPLATLILNKLRAGLKVAAVKAPGFGENRKANLQDIAVLTGAQVVSEELGMKLETTELEALGTARKVTITKDDTILLDGAGAKDSIQERCEQIREAASTTTSDYDRDKLQERLAKLSGGVAVLKIGGASEVEVGEKKDRVTDALNATKAAVDEGIVPGGGAALLHASRSLSDVLESMSNLDQRVGVEIVMRAVQMPAKTLCRNAGHEGAVIVGKLLESDDQNWGFDAAKGQFCNMVDAGIIDPLKVVRTALVDAASVSSLITTSECIVVEAPADESAKGPPGGMPGGMDGMY
uniref:Heat shock protein 60 n=1 Tax=Ulva pertusa TaxID=3120 RepID=H1AE07_ULVPE|nr:heat shock protein 60 [Ulva pertusa]